MTVMELGCGPGLHTIDFAKAIGKEGKLYAVDIRPEYIDILKRRLEKPEYKGINNIEIKLASAYDLPFQDDSIDLVMRQISEWRLV
jgi:ubiquinone/menaquinone biosynthesis C-methylase UbiE